MLAKIVLQDLEFWAYHGVYEFEQEIGNLFQLTAIIELNVQEISTTDDISKGLDYTQLYKSIEKKMKNPSKTLENLVFTMGTYLKRDYPSIEKLTLILHKMSPALGGKSKSVSIEMSF